MRKNWKKIAFLVAGPIGLYLLFSFAGGMWVSLNGKLWLTSKIKYIYPSNVSIQNIESNYLNKITVSGLSIKKKHSLEISKAVLTFQPIKYFLSPQQSSIFHLQIDDPNLVLNLQNKKSEESKKSEPIKDVWLPFLIDINNGSVRLNREGKSLVSENVYAVLQKKGAYLSVEGNANSGSIQNLDIDFSMVLDDSREWTFQADVEHVGLSALKEFLPKIKGTEGLNGTLGATLVASGSGADKSIIEDSNWTLEIRDKNLRWSPKRGFKNHNVTLNAKLTPKNIFGEIWLDRSFHLKGDYKNPFEKPTMDVSFKATGTPYSEVMLVLGISTQTRAVNGDLNFDFNLKGSPAKPKLSGRFSFNPNKGLLKFPFLSGDLDYQNGELAIAAAFAEGKFILSSPSPGNDPRHFQISIDDLSLAELATLNGWKNVGGRIKTDLNFLTQKNDFTLSGKFLLNEFVWGRHSEEKPISGKINIKNQEIELRTNEDRLTLKAAVREKDMELSQFRIRLGEESEFSANGNINFEDNSFRLFVSGQQIPPDTWPPLVRRYPNISGFLDFDGIFRGTRQDPEAKLQVVFNRLKFIPDGGTWNGTSQIFWQDNKFALKNIQVDGGYRGAVNWNQNDNSGKWLVNLTMDQANPRLIWDVFKSTNNVSGILTGQADLEIQSKKMVGVSSITWTNGELEKLKFDQFSVSMNLDEKNINVDRFLLLREEQALRGSGDLQRAGDSWNFQSEVQSQQWAIHKFKIDGEGTSNGRFNLNRKTLSASIDAPLLWVNEYPFENLILNVRKTKKRISLSGETDNQIKFGLNFKNPNKKMSGSLVGKDLDVDILSQKFLPPFGFNADVVGKADAKITFKGTVSDPLLQVNVDLSSGTWRDENLASKLFLKITKPKISLVSSRTVLEKGGTVFAKGEINLSDEKSLDIEGVGSDLTLNSVFQMLRWPVTWDGVTNGTFNLKGPADNRVTNVVFEGEHQGYGPFTQGGSISGVARGEKGEWNVEGIKIGSGNGHLQLRKGSRIFIDRDKSGKMRMVADTRNLQAGILTFFGGVELTGAWKGTDLVNENESVAKEIDVFARSLWINQFLLNGNITHLTVKDGQLTFSPILGSGQQLSGKLFYDHFPEILVEELVFLDEGVEKLYLDGYVGSPKWDFTLRTQGIDANIVRGLFDTTLPFSGPMDLRVKGTGNLEDPKVKGNVVWRNGSLGILPIDFGTCRVILDDGIIDVEKISAKKKKGYFVKGNLRLGTNLSEKGIIQKPEINLKIERGDFAILKEIWPEVTRSKGSFDALLSVSGTDSDRFISGYFNANDVKFHSSSYIPYLKRGNLSLTLDQNQLKINHGRAKLNKGYVNLSGTIDFQDGEPYLYNLVSYTSSKRGVSIRVPDLAIPPGPVLGRFSILKRKLAGISRGDPQFNLKLEGPAARPTLSGKVSLENTIFTYPPAPGKKGTGRVNAVQKWIAEFMNKLNWDVVVSAGKRTRYENSLVDARVNGSLHISGSHNDISVNGRILSDQGSIVYSGNEFTINEAALEVITQKTGIEQTDKKQTFVYLKANAEKEVFYTDGLGDSNQETIIMEVDRALLGEIQPRFRAKNNPGLSSQRALQLALGLPISESLDQNELLAGQTQGSDQEDFDRILRTGLVQLLDSSLASPLARAIARQTGLVDFIRVTYQEDELSAETETSQENSLDGETSDVNQNEFLRAMKGTKVKMGRELSSRLFADYSFRVDEFENELDLRHEVELAYRVHRNFFLRAISELDSERTLGRPPDRRALLENRWRFGLPRKKKKPVADKKNKKSAIPGVGPAKG